MASFWDTLLGKTESYKMPENSPYPTVEDAVAARARGEFKGGPYQFWVEDQKESYLPPRQGALAPAESGRSATPSYAPAAQYAQPTRGELPRTDLDMQQRSNEVLGATRRPITQETQDMLAREALAAKRLYLSQLGFDPARVLLMPKGVSYGGTGGEYSAEGDYSISNPRMPGNMTHEALHRAIKQLVEAKALPTSGPYSKPDKLDFEEENLVRRIMQKYFGDVEAGRRPQRYTDALGSFDRNYEPAATRYITGLEEAAKKMLEQRAKPTREK